jgi:hypothetical protein
MYIFIVFRISPKHYYQNHFYLQSQSLFYSSKLIKFTEILCYKSTVHFAKSVFIERDLVKYRQHNSKPWSFQYV